MLVRPAPDRGNPDHPAFAQRLEQHRAERQQEHEGNIGNAAVISSAFVAVGSRSPAAVM